MMTKQNIELILCNHETMLLACPFLFDTLTDESLDNLKEDMVAFNIWIFNGGRETLKELSECDGETVLQIVDYLREAPLYNSVRVNNRDFLLVHSGLGEFDPNKKIEDYSIDELIWTRPKLTQKYFDDMIVILGQVLRKEEFRILTLFKMF